MVNRGDGSQDVPPSRTALGVARLRALHQLRDGGRILADPFALALCGEAPAALLASAETPFLRHVRHAIAARSRIAEDLLAEAVGAGVRQLVMLGAGLDSFALRNPFAASGLRVFELDRPATLSLKQARLRAAGLPIPDSLSFVPVDLERADLAATLAATSYRADRPGFFIWLGVTVYLTREAIARTLRSLAALPDAMLVFDYSNRPEAGPQALRRHALNSRRRVALAGESWVSHFTPEEIGALLRACGLRPLRDLDRAAIEAWLAGERAPRAEIQQAGSHIVWARTAGRTDKPAMAAIG